MLIDFGERGFYHPSSVRSVSQSARESTLVPGVTQVYAATTTGLPALLLGQYYVSQEVARASPVAALVNATVSQDGRYALVRVFPGVNLGPRDNACGAACGVVTLVFQERWGASLFGLAGGLGFVETVVPLFLFTLVFGLSMDYKVFVVSRLHEAHRQGLPDREAVLQAIASTASIITTSAALIMITVFVMFTFSGVVLIKALSPGLTVAVLLDATLMRLTLVPAILSLAGRWNWWLPLRQREPNLHEERTSWQRRSDLLLNRPRM